MKRRCYTPVFLALCVASGTALAKVAADPNHPYPVAPEAGPWMICAASFSGDAAAKMAHDLVLELRSRYQVPAYVYNRAEEERRKQEEELKVKQKHWEDYFRHMGVDPGMPMRVRKVRIDDQFAVLIGGYKDIEPARRALEQIRKMTPKSVPPNYLVTTDLDPAAAGQNATTTTLHPFANSFVVRNPTIAAPRAAAGPDPLLKELNRGEKYSLSACPKPWTLVVKDFQGAVVFQSSSASTSFMKELLGGNSGGRLDACAKQAQEVARVLRDMGFEAYVWHTRYCSLVTVGGYDNAQDPKLLQTQRTLANLQLGPVVQLFSNPVAMEVPRP